MAEMTAGRCTVVSFDPAFSFDAPIGWTWSGFRDVGGFFWPKDAVPDEGEPLNVTYYRYGGEVAIDGCETENGRLRIATAVGLVDWIESLSDLNSTVETRTIGGRDAWLVDLKVDGVPSCTFEGQPAVFLWSFEDPDRLLALGAGGVYRVYVIDSPTGVVMIAVQHWKLVNTQPYFDAADVLVSSISFE